MTSNAATDRAPRRTQQQRRADTERRVLDAAVSLIAQHGSRSLSLAQVGEAAGYSRGIVHQHFGSREGLLSAVMRDAQHFKIPTYEGDGLDQLARIVDAYLHNVATRKPAARAFLQLWGEAIAADPTLTSIFAQTDAEFRSFLADRIRAGIQDGSIRGDVDPAAAAVLLLALTRGSGLQLIATPPVRNLRLLTQEARRTVRAAFGSQAVT